MWISSFAKPKNGKGKPKLDIKIKRVPFEMTVVGHETVVILGHAILNDISPKGIAIYTNIKVTEGQEVVIKFKEPRVHECKGTVIFCVENLSDSHIVSQNVFTLRVGVLLKFASEEEQKKHCEILQDLEFNFLGIQNGVATPATATPAPAAPAAATAPAATDAPAAETAATTEPAPEGGALPEAA